MNGYKEIAEDVRIKIMNGTYPVNSILPNEEALASQFHVSRVTISRTFRLLKEEGFIVTKRGVGAMVLKPEQDSDFDVEQYYGLTHRLGKEASIQSTIISFSLRFPEEEEMDKLSIKANEPVYDIIRLRSINNEPSTLEYTIMPIRIIPGVDENILKRSIYEHIQKDLHLEVGASIRRIKADKPDAYDQKYLHCSKEDPVLEVEQVVRLKDGTPFEYSQSRSRYDHSTCVYYSSGRPKDRKLKGRD